MWREGPPQHPSEHQKIMFAQSPAAGLGGRVLKEMLQDVSNAQRHANADTVDPGNPFEDGPPVMIRR
jgi:hypothetical protein